MVLASKNTPSTSVVISRITALGVITDIETGPNGHLFVASIDHGTVYEVFRVR